MKRRYHSRVCSKELHNETCCADRVKIIAWDQTGLVMVWKSLSGANFRWPPIVDGCTRLGSVANFLSG